MPACFCPGSFVAGRPDGSAHPGRHVCGRAKKYCTEPLFIKTHPRDTTDYSKLFPTAVILPRTMPSEVLNFCLPFKFQRAVTVQSWVLRGFTAAEEKVFVGLEEAEKLVQG